PGSKWPASMSFGRARLLDPRVGAERLDGVVGDKPLPDQTPERVHRFGREAAAGPVVYASKKRRTVVTQEFDDIGSGSFELRSRYKWLAQSRHVIGQVERDAPVPLPERLDTDPDDFAGAHQRVEHRRRVVLNARRQHFPLEYRRGDRGALQLFDGIEQR